MSRAFPSIPSCSAGQCWVPFLSAFLPSFLPLPDVIGFLNTTPTPLNQQVPNHFHCRKRPMSMSDLCGTFGEQAIKPPPRHRQNSHARPVWMVWSDANASTPRPWSSREPVSCRRSDRTMCCTLWGVKCWLTIIIMISWYGTSQNKTVLCIHVGKRSYKCRDGMTLYPWHKSFHIFPTCTIWTYAYCIHVQLICWFDNLILTRKPKLWMWNVYISRRDLVPWTNCRSNGRTGKALRCGLGRSSFW